MTHSNGNGEGKHFGEGRESEPMVRLFRTRKSDVISALALVVAAPIAVHSFQLRGAVQDLIEEERRNARRYADERLAQFHREIKEDIGELKERITEVRSDVREIRVEVLRGKRR